MSLIDKVKFDTRGLVTAIAQDAYSGQILMVAYMNRDTLAETIKNRVMVYWSRSRQERWLKGDTSGHIQKVREAFIDCDGDALVFKVEQTGGACHKGYLSCFFRKEINDSWEIIEEKIKD